MSGVKTRTITDSEYQRLLRQARAAEDARRRAEAERRAKDQIANDLRVAKTYNKDLENRIKNIGNNLDKVQKDASDTKKQLIATVQKTNDALKQQSDAFDRKLSDLGNDMADAMDRNNRRIEQVINRNNEEIKEDIDTLRKQTKEEIDAVKKSVSGLAKKVGDPQALINAGKDYLDIALELIGSLKDSRHAMFFPGEMDKVIAAADKAKNHINEADKNPANASNALLTGEEAFDAAHKLFQDVAEAETLWKSKLALALEALTTAQAEIEAREEIVLKDEDEKDVKLDTDFWSEGALSKLKEQIANIREILKDDEKAKKLTLDDLDGIADLSKDIIDDSEDVRNGAVFAILSSQERVNLAEDLAGDLASLAGLTIIKAEGYEGDDMRAANLIHLKNGTTGFEVVITLKPVFRNGKCGYEAETDIINEGSSQRDAEVFDEVLKQVMGSYGLSGDNPIPVKPEKENEIRGWQERERAQTVSTVKANPDIINGADKIKRTANN